MRVPDVNVLLYARDELSPYHDVAVTWINESFSGEERIGLAIHTLLAFVRISTNPQISAAPLRTDEAFDQIDALLQRPVAVVVHPGPRHLRLVRELLGQAGGARNLTSDAHLAALAIEHNATLTSFDGDFHRFEGLSFEYLR